jgi:hypothetical protein
MKNPPIFALLTLLFVLSSPSFAVQDPKVSAAVLEARQKAIDGELSRIDQTLGKSGRSKADEVALLKRRNALMVERKSLATSRSIGKSVSKNPLVRYSGDNDGTPTESKLDRLFER